MANYGKTKKNPRRKTSSQQEDSIMEDLELFQQWRKEVLPELRELLLKGAGPKELAKKYASHAVARMVTIALTEKDPTKAFSACKDLIDRSEGKATETQKIEHKYAEMDETELNSILQSELGDLEVLGIVDPNAVPIKKKDDKKDDSEGGNGNLQ